MRDRYLSMISCIIMMALEEIDDGWRTLLIEYNLLTFIHMKNLLLLPLVGALVLMASCQPVAKEGDALKAYPSVKEMMRPFGEQDIQHFMRHISTNIVKPSFWIVPPGRTHEVLKILFPKRTHHFFY